MNNSYCISFSIVTQHFSILCDILAGYTQQTINVDSHTFDAMRENDIYTFFFLICQNNFCHYPHIHFHKNLFHLNEYPLSMLCIYFISYKKIIHIFLLSLCAVYLTTQSIFLRWNADGSERKRKYFHKRMCH